MCVLRQGLEAGRMSEVSRRTSVVLGVLAAVGALAIAAVASGGADPGTASSSWLTRRASVPSGLLKDLIRLDQGLTQLIREERRGDGLSHDELLRRVTEIKKAKLAMVDRFFGEPVYGVKFSELFRRLDSLDVLLTAATFIEIHGGNQAAANDVQKAQNAKQKLETEFLKVAQQPPTQPQVTPIHAVFTPEPFGQACAPPSCQTVYTEDAIGDGLIYAWSVSIPPDPACAAGFQPNTPQPNQATWYHADVSEGGHCNHSGTTYDPNGRGHPGTVVVVVSNSAWTCTATYFGTQGNGTPVGDGDPPQPCQPKVISEQDTWTHSVDGTKTTICNDLQTSPPMASVSGEMTGPSGFDAKTNGTQPLRADGSAQIRTTISHIVAGAYTAKFAVYDKSGKPTATSSNTFVVAAPPQNGPPPKGGPSCPAP